MSILWRVLFVLDGMAAVLIGSELSLSEIPPIYGCDAMAIAVPLSEGTLRACSHIFAMARQGERNPQRLIDGALMRLTL